MEVRNFHGDECPRGRASFHAAPEYMKRHEKKAQACQSLAQSLLAKVDPPLRDRGRRISSFLVLDLEITRENADRFVVHICAVTCLELFKLVQTTGLLDHAAVW